MQSSIKSEILGEPARRISWEFQQSHPQINWRSLIDLRNIIARCYNEVKPEILWGVIISDIPLLLEHLENLLPPFSDD